MMLFPFFKGVRGFGNGFPSLEPIPAASMMILKRRCDFNVVAKVSFLPIL